MASEAPDRKELRTFGISLGVVCLLWAGILWWRGHGAAVPWLLGAAPVLVLLALVAPFALRPIHFVWMPVARGIARVFTWLLLTLAYYLVFTPFGIVMRMLGKDPLQRRFEPEAATYWEARNDGPFEAARLTKQY
jgi:hypothetical protein